MEFDFDAKGWDLLDVWRGRMSLRKLWVRIQGLPRTSEFCRAVEPQLTRWGAGEHLVADFIDEFRRSIYERPAPWPRPGDAERVADIRAARGAKYLARQRRSNQLKGGR